MAKKIDDTEVKKECPSCGLGVALDSTICEFCGWDFEEEDEWILQIERLERDLILEKKRAAPGTMESKIEQTIHTPAVARAEMLKASQLEKKGKEAEDVPQAPRFSPSPSTRSVTQAATPEPQARVRQVRVAEERPPSAVSPEPEHVSAPAAPEAEKRVVRTAKSPPSAPEVDKEATPAAQKKTRVLRKVKK